MSEKNTSGGIGFVGLLTIVFHSPEALQGNCVVMAMGSVSDLDLGHYCVGLCRSHCDLRAHGKEKLRSLNG